MKKFKFLSVLLVFTLLFSCNQEPVEESSSIGLVTIDEITKKGMTYGIYAGANGGVYVVNYTLDSLQVEKLKE